ncbi:MAG: phospho-N-acetylmuramoyl-pentapeptide-transferase, partial [Bacteroidales bacterium]
MLYYLFHYLDKTFDLPGGGLFNYVTFRSGMAFIIALLFSTIAGKKIIGLLQKMQIGETIRDLGLEGQMSKKGTPTMGGVIIILSILIPCLLVSKLGNVYMLLMLVTTLWLGTIGFLDDYIKVFKKDKEGLKGRFKIIGQVGLGLIVGLALYLSPNVVIRQNQEVMKKGNVEAVNYMTENIKSTQTTIPFVKNNNFDYADLVGFMGDTAQDWGWIIFILITIFIV